MENKREENKPVSPDNEAYDINHPQNISAPAFNSDTTHRESSGLPAVENLNQPADLNSDSHDINKEDIDASMPVNDGSFHGEALKTDLGSGQRGKEEDEDEKIIRT